MTNKRTTLAGSIAGLLLLAKPFLPAEYQPLIDPAAGLAVALLAVLAKDK